MPAYVIKSWSAGSQPDRDGNYLNIQGRAGGFVSWLLNLLGISPTVRLTVRADKIIFERGSMREGTFTFLTPLDNICSTFYAFKKPLTEALILGAILGAATFFLFGIPGIVVAILYYVLNKTLTVGFTDVGGRVSEIPFKRSVIEGRVLDEAEASRVSDLIQRLVDARQRPVVSQDAPTTPRIAAYAPPKQESGHCPKCSAATSADGRFCENCGCALPVMTEIPS